MAWLNTAPKPDPRRVGSQVPPPDAPPPKTRLDAMGGPKSHPPMPPNPMPHVIDRLVEIGLTEAAGMGVGPISWGTLTEWQRNTGVRLAPWEARLLRRLSVAYLAESRAAEHENCPAPWGAPATAQERDAEAADLHALLG